MKRTKLSPSADDMMAYKGNSKESIKKLSELINDFSKNRNEFGGEKINVQKSKEWGCLGDSVS